MANLVIRTAVATLATLLFVIVASGFLIRWPLRDPTMRTRVIRAVERSSGMTAEVEGGISLVLLPRPTLKLRSVHMANEDRSVSLDANAVTGALSVGGLMGGQALVVSTTLDDPTVAIDLDRFMPVADGAADILKPGGNLADLRTEGLTLRSGVVRVHSSDPRLDSLFTDVDATWEWPKGDSGASLNGRMTLHGNPLEASLMLDSPMALLNHETSGAFVRVKSPAIDLTAEGKLSGRADVPAAGRLSASTPSLPHFLRMFGTPLVALDGIGAASIAGDLAVADKALALSDVELTLGDMLFEGAMAFHHEGGHPGVAGTLATDTIELDPFLNALPTPHGVDKTWSQRLFATPRVAFDNIDLRVSASHARIGRFDFEDGGLSLQSGGGRMEISLGEARAYDGLFKGRVVAQLDGDRTAVRAEATFSQLNLEKLAADLGGIEAVSGTSTGHATLEGSGMTPAQLVSSLNGHAQFVVRNGEVGPRLIAAAIQPQAGPTGIQPALPRYPVPFDSAVLGFDIKDGTAAITEGWMLRSDLRATVNGAADLATQTITASAGLAPIGDDLLAETGPQVRLTLTGPWDALKLGFDGAPAGAAPSR